MVTDEEGAAAVRAARASIHRTLSGETGADPVQALPTSFDERRGVFVTLRRRADGELRGCIGLPLPRLPLRAGLKEAAVSSAVDDPRFPPLTLRELDQTLVEVSVLTVPVPLEAVEPGARARAVRVGHHGLIVEARGTSGLLLPQVAVEQGWDARTFLAQTCVKAGLWPESWTSPAVRFRTFEAEVFAEEAPGGPVHRVPLGRD